MNICIATSSFPANPEDQAHAPFLIDAIASLRRAGHDVSVLTQAREVEQRAPDGVDVTWFPWRQLSGRLAEKSFATPSAARSAASLIWNGTRRVAERRRAGVDVFLCAWVIPSGLYVYLDQVFQRGDTPYVLWALGSDVNKYKHNPLVRQALRLILRRAAHV